MHSFVSIQTPSGAQLRTATFKRTEGSSPRGVCVLLSGRSEFIEKYEEVISELCGRGFDVATFDWRGQGGSSRALANPLYGHVNDFAEFDEDLATFLEQIVRPLSSTPPLVVAHSMGGHILLRTLHDHPSAFRAAVLSAPMVDVYGRRTMRYVLPVMNLLGLSERPFSRKKETDPLNVAFNDNALTSDQARYSRYLSLIKAHPELRLGAPTWGWLNAANTSLSLIGSKGYAESISTPVLIYGAGDDRICVTSAAQRFSKRIPNATYIEFEKSEHEVLMEQDNIRSRFWKAFDDFVIEQFATLHDLTNRQ